MQKEVQKQEISVKKKGDNDDTKKTGIKIVKKYIKDANKAKKLVKKLKKDLGQDGNFALKIPGYKGVDYVLLDYDKLIEMEQTCEDALDKNLLNLIDSTFKRKRDNEKGLGSANSRIVYFKHSPLYEFLINCDLGYFFDIVEDEKKNIFYKETNQKLIDLVPLFKDGFTTISMLQDLIFIYTIYNGNSKGIKFSFDDNMKKYFCEDGKIPFFCKILKEKNSDYSDSEILSESENEEVEEESNNDNREKLNKIKILCGDIKQKKNINRNCLYYYNLFNNKPVEPDDKITYFQFNSLICLNTITLNELKKYYNYFDKFYKTKDFEKAKKTLESIERNEIENIKKNIFLEKEYAQRSKQFIQTQRAINNDQKRIDKISNRDQNKQTSQNKRNNRKNSLKTEPEEKEIKELEETEIKDIED